MPPLKEYMKIALDDVKIYDVIFISMRQLIADFALSVANKL